MLNLVANGPSGYNINNSLRFRSSASAYLSRTPASAGNRQKFTISFWAKIGALGQNSFIWGNTADNNALQILITANYQFYIYDVNAASGGLQINSAAVYRDPSAWYHFVVAFDTTQATDSNRLKVYINGVQQDLSTWTVGSGASRYPSLNANMTFNNTSQHSIGRTGYGYRDGYDTEWNFVDGQQLTPSSFGSTNSTTGVWQPAKYTGTYGTNGFYLKFSNIALTSGSNTGLGQDFSGNGNYWNTNNISVTAGTTYDAMTDVPTLTSATVANYATLNPLNPVSGGAFSNANLTFTESGGAYGSAASTIGMTTGKFYFEITSNGSFNHVGAINELFTNFSQNIGASNGITYINYNGQVYSNNVLITTLSTYTTGDVVGVAIDIDNKKIWFALNGTWLASGSPSTGTNPVVSAFTGTTFYFAVSCYTNSITSNFGQQGFKYTPPTGYVALNTYNLPTSTIVQGNKYMDASLWTGTGASLNVTNTAGFKPDFVWVKSRSSASWANFLQDTNRGITEYLISNSTGAAGTTSPNIVNAVNTNGFQVLGNGNSNNTGDTYVGWQWQAGQGSSSSNTNGSITSTVSVNTTAGFSVVTYTGNGTNGATVGHGLGVAPKMIITKVRSTTGDWYVWQTAMGDNAMRLNTTAAQIPSTSNSIYNTASFSSSVFALGNGAINGSGSTFVAYCWAEIAGFSKFTSYTGNGSADGPFVFTNFQPKFVMIKCSSAVEEWYIYDSVRNTYNLANTVLNAESSAAEYTASASVLDILSNGFKIRGAAGGLNVSSATYIVMAFASNPFKNSNAR